MEHPKLKDIHKLSSYEPYPLNEIPDDLLIKIGTHFIYLICTGRKDITGTDWGDTFAQAIGGRHLDSPIGIADVTLNKMAWSLKTIKNSNPFNCNSVRLISGRCSPDYSYGITDPHKDIQKTGRAVLNIWNERINIAQDNYNPIRTSILIRSNNLLNFLLFEEESRRYRTSDYYWEVNSNGNLIGKETETGFQKFTWQPHGSQLTIHTKVPCQAARFSIKQPPQITKQQLLDSINFSPLWITIKKKTSR